MFNKATKVTDFAGQNLYVGIDTHFKSWTVSIYSDEFELKTFSQEPNAEQLHQYLKKQYSGANYQLAYEAGFSGFWIQRAFSSMGLVCHVIHPADVPSSDKELKRKTDKVDSRKIAKGLRSKALNSVFVPDEELESDRQLLRSRAKIVKDTTSVKNRIKAFLKFKGIEIPKEYKSGNWTQSFIKWLQTIELTGSSRIGLSAYIDELIFLIEKERKLQLCIKCLSNEPRYKRNVILLQSVPAIGLIASMTLLTEIGDVNRFTKPDHLCSYCGLTPNIYSSGSTERVGGMSKRGNGIIKMILIECAWMAVRKDPVLLLFYKQQLPRMCANKAIVKVARKLLNRIRYVLKNQKEYVAGVVA